jgi:hypothetical protein
VDVVSERHLQLFNFNWKASHWAWYRDRFFDSCPCHSKKRSQKSDCDDSESEQDTPPPPPSPQQQQSRMGFAGSNVERASWDLSRGLDIQTSRPCTGLPSSPKEPRFLIECVHLLHDPHACCGDRRHLKRLRFEFGCGKSSLKQWVYSLLPNIPHSFCSHHPSVSPSALPI